jgi:hypothetical protein
LFFSYKTRCNAGRSQEGQRRDDRLMEFAPGVGGMLTSFISDSSRRGRSP